MSAHRKIDVVTFEVLRHRMWEINDEMGMIAARCSPLTMHGISRMLRHEGRPARCRIMSARSSRMDHPAWGSQNTASPPDIRATKRRSVSRQYDAVRRVIHLGS